MYCTNCGARVAEGTRFCTSCGAPIEESSPAPEPAQEPTVVAPRPAVQAKAPTRQAPDQLASPTTAIAIATIVASLAVIVALGMASGLIPGPFGGSQGTQAQDSPSGTPADATATSTEANDATSATSGDATSAESDEATSASTLTYQADGTVHSSSYGYSLTLPGSFGPSGTVSDERAVFADSQSQVTITVTADTNPSGQSVSDAYASATADLGESPYTTQDDDWYVVSDIQGSQVRYVMCYVEDGRRVAMEIDYPVSERDYGRSVVEAVQPTFSLAS